MKRMFSGKLHRARIAFAALSVFVVVFALSPVLAAWVDDGPPTWTQNNAYQAYTAYTWTNPTYFYTGPQTFSWNNPSGNGTTYANFLDHQGATRWSTFWTEAEEIEVAEDAYDWDVRDNNSINTQKYIDQINALCEGFIDKMWPMPNGADPTPTNFGQGVPWNGGDPYNWHGTGFKDANYANLGDPPNSGGNGDWFNDDLMWAAMAFARAYQITRTPGWLTAAEEQVDYVWSNAQAWTDPNGTAVGLLQSFCNVNRPTKDGNCLAGDPGDLWNPNLDAEVNFPFVIAASMLADILRQSGNPLDTLKANTYQAEAQAVYNWAIANLYSETTPEAHDCTNLSGVTCASIYDANNSGNDLNGNHTGYTGEGGYWKNYTYFAPQAKWGKSFIYGVAIEAAVRMHDYTIAQPIANHLMYGLSNPDFPYPFSWSYNGHNYNILPNYWAITSPPAYGDEGLNGIALRGVAYGINSGYLDDTTRKWAQINVQAAWNNRVPNVNIMWGDWKPGDQTGVNPNYGSYTYQAWDCSSAVAGILNVPHP